MIYRRHFLILLAVGLVTFFSAWLHKQAVHSDVITNIITFLSIFLGFVTTSISVLFGSKYAQVLSRTADSKRPNQSLLGTLNKYFLLTTYISLLSILLLGLYPFFATRDAGGNLSYSLELTIFSVNFDFGKIFLPLILTSFALSVSLFAILQKSLLTAFMNSSKQSSS
jgi:hypothetical protein